MPSHVRVEPAANAAFRGFGSQVQSACICGIVRAMRRRPTIAAGFALVVLVVAQLAAHAHRSATRHVTCEEHGEELEAAVVVAAHPDDGVARWLAVEDGGGEEHEECLFASALRQGGLAPAHARAPIAIAALELSPPPRTAETIAVAALYRLAPKTSPPLARG
jgi:hypothetical protein